MATFLMWYGAVSLGGACLIVASAAVSMLVMRVREHRQRKHLDEAIAELLDVKL